MQQLKENNNRIAKNTLVLYFRMILLMFVSLYTSRIILEALGVADFGIYNIVGGLVGLLGFFTSSLTNVSQRYLNLGIGANNKHQTIIFFKQCGTILFIFSIATLLLGETIGLWFVMNKLVIPSERLIAAFWVYQFSLFSVVCSINQVTFLGTIVAYEKMSVYAYLGLFEAFARLAIAYVIMQSSFDHLVLYAVLTALVSALVFAFHIIYCKLKFETCNIGFYWEKTLVKEMSKFISSNLFGCFAWSAGVQGSNIVMNMFFGPVVNAAKGISVQVSAVVLRFTDNMMTAVKPQIIKSYSSGDISYMLNLLMSSSKFSFFLSAIISIPILADTDYILSLWLKNVPDYAVAFSRIVILESMASVFVVPLWIAANATGNIKRNQVYGRMFTLSALPLSYIVLNIMPNPVLVVIIGAVMQYLYWFYCIYDINQQLHMDVSDYVNRVVFPSIALVAIILPVSICINSLMESTSVIIFVIKFLIIVLLGLIVAYLLMTKSERNFAHAFVTKKTR